MDTFSFFFGIYLKVDLLGHMVTLCLTIRETATVLSKKAHRFISLLAVCDGSNSPYRHRHLLLSDDARFKIERIVYVPLAYGNQVPRFL